MLLKRPPSLVRFNIQGTDGDEVALPGPDPDVLQRCQWVALAVIDNADETLVQNDDEKCF